MEDFTESEDLMENVYDSFNHALLIYRQSIEQAREFMNDQKEKIDELTSKLELQEIITERLQRELNHEQGKIKQIFKLLERPLPKEDPLEGRC